MKFSIDHNSNVPLYKQVVNAVKDAVNTGRLENGATLPSLSEFAAATGVSMETTKKAYNILKKEGIMSGRQGKGYFIDIRKKDAPLRVLMLMDKLSAYKLAIHKGFTEALTVPADITINIHNQDIELFRKIIDQAADQYDYFIVAAHFPSSVKDSSIMKILRRLPNERLILIDRDIPEYKGRIGRIYQDFANDSMEALRPRLDLLRKYSNVVILTSATSRYSGIIIPRIATMLKENGVKHTIRKEFNPSALKKGTLYIVIGSQLDNEHFAILREASAKGLVLGADLGLVTYNDEPVNEFICGGLSCISSDFEQMGRSAAGMISSGGMSSIHNPFRLILRASL